MQRLTIGEVAKKANVSKSTVSQFLNNRFEYMSAETKKRIEQAIKELDYKPNYVARSLKQKSTSTIGVIVANILHTFSTQVIRSIEDVCRESGFHVIVCNADDDPEKEKTYIDMLRAKQVDGLVIFPTGDNLDLYHKMVDEKYPVVFVDRYVQDLPIDSILLDNEEATRLAVQHFVESGFERIGILTTSLVRNITPRVERVNGFKKALMEYSIPIRDEYIKGIELSRMTAALQEMFTLEHPPQALLAGNDLSLMEILKYVQEHNLAVPKDLGLIGIDEVSFSSFFAPSLTTISQPAFEMGKKAASLLLNKIKKKKVPEFQIYRFKPTLIVRDSSRRDKKTYKRA